jgi:hypothetical protein
MNDIKKLRFVMVDVESDGPIPGDYSMTEIGMVVVEPSLKHTFHGKLKPISDKWDPEFLAISGRSREEVLKFPFAEKTMKDIYDWLISFDFSPMFIADNNGFDYMFTHWYFYHFIGKSPFGHSSSNLNSLFKGIKKEFRASFKKYRRTIHDHNPVNDALGNAEALLAIAKKYDIKPYHFFEAI